MKIINNMVYNNGGTGIFCSLDRYNILIQNNTVYDNTGAGIYLSRNMHDSVVRFNTIYNSKWGISLPESPNNNTYWSVIYNVSGGVYLTNPLIADDGNSTGNRIYNNKVMDADTGIRIVRAEGNFVSGNAFENIKFRQHSLQGVASGGVQIDGETYSDGDEIPPSSYNNSNNNDNISSPAGVTFFGDEVEGEEEQEQQQDSHLLLLLLLLLVLFSAHF
jgi:parallel beta-helix repeat protein